MRTVKQVCFKLVLVVLASLTINCNFTNTRPKSAQKEVVKGTYVRSELAWQHGMELFNLHCANCHNFMGNEIGPNLSGVTSEVSKEWLASFIKDPKAVINSGDQRAVALYDTYKMYMPSFPMLKDKDMEDLLAFIHQFSEAEKKNISSRKGGLINPIKERIPTSDLSLVIEEWLTVPPSSDSGPRARINKLTALSTTEGERLFLSDLRGKLYEIIEDTVQVYLDLKETEQNFMDHPGLGSGLGSFDFHPDFETNGLLYTTHTEPAKTMVADFTLPDSIQVGLQWVLTEWKTRTPSSLKFSGEKRELLRVDMVSAVHGFQELTFNPLSKKGDLDYGLLYLGVGDGGAANLGYPDLCDTNERIWGSILRIDPAGSNSKNGKYGIPDDNPYAKETGKVGEIWCRGFRNPHRISWNRNGGGQMFVSNIGNHSVEEINLVQKGADYGWPNREGAFLFDVQGNTELVYPLPQDDSGYTYPVVQYDHDEGNAVSGGFVYSGANVPELKNKYIFGDIPRGTLFYSEVGSMIAGQQAPIFKLGLEIGGQATDMGQLTDNVRVDLRFGVDSAGELYIFCKSNGKVYRVIGCKPNGPTA